MKGIYDIHCHIVPGVDDGAKDLKTSVRMLQKEYDDRTVGLLQLPLDLLYKMVADTAGFDYNDSSIAGIRHNCTVDYSSKRRCIYDNVIIYISYNTDHVFKLSAS